MKRAVCLLAGGLALLLLLSARAALAETTPWRAHAAQARVAVQLLRAAGQHGLQPRHYAVPAAVERLDSLSAQEAAPLEQALDAALLRYLGDVHGGRTKPDFAAPPPELRQPPFDPAELVQRALRAGNLAAALDEAQPHNPLYLRVKATLAAYRTLAEGAQPPALAVPRKGAPKLVAGTAYADAAVLRARLQQLGDLDAGAAPQPDALYSAQLAEAVRRFQARHGLEPDGTLGPATLAALNVPLAHRVQQLALTLERLRWVPALRPGRILVVNLPAFRLWGFDTAHRDANRDANRDAPIEMRVIVGTAARTPTPLFIGQLRYLEFNPYWNVPRSIEQGEILPKLARDPAYLARNDMELVGRDGKVAGADGAAALAALRAGSLRVRQRPGPKNVLGALKFAMPNPMNIYLHSTSAQELFRRTRRDLSHGCIRVENPAQLAEFVLADPQAWPAAQVQAAMQPGPARTVALKETVPVVLFYATAVTDRQGRALFAEDIYRRDAPLIAAMAAD